MKKYYITFVSVVLLSLSVDAYAQQNTGQVGPQYVKQLDVEINNLQKQMDKNDDPAEHNKMVKRLLSLYGAYYNNDVRYEIIRQQNPTWAQKIAEYEALPEAARKARIAKKYRQRLEVSDFVRQNMTSSWPYLPDEQKLAICAFAVESCEADKFLNCKFVLDKCRPYIDEGIYQKFWNKYGRDN